MATSGTLEDEKQWVAMGRVGCPIWKKNAVKGEQKGKMSLESEVLWLRGLNFRL